MTVVTARSAAFSVVADGVAAGLAAPWRIYLAPGRRYLSFSVADQVEWEAWRARLGCSELTLRVHETAGVLRFSSVAEVVRDGVRIAIELLEDVGLGDVRDFMTDPEVAR